MKTQDEPARSHGSVTSTAPLFWYFRPDPDEHAWAQDQEPPSSKTRLAFNKTIQVNEARSAQNLPFLDRTLPCITELQGQAARPSWPLSWFQDHVQLPPASDMAQFKDACTRRLGPFCSVLTDLSEQETSTVRPPVGLAMASLGAALYNSTCHRDVWMHTNRMIILTIALNNKMTRNHLTYLSGMLNDMAAVVIDDPEIQRLSNITHGIINTAMRRCWQAQQLEPTRLRSGPALGKLLPHFLEADLVRSLRHQTLTTTVSAFGDVPLDLSLKSTCLKDLAVTVFSQRDTEWTFTSHDEAFLKLLLILNEIVTHALMFEPLQDPKYRAVGAITSLSIGEETRRLRMRIKHALSGWQSSCFPHATLSVQALYHLCQLYLLNPRLHLLVASVQKNASADGDRQLTAPSADQLPLRTRDSSGGHEARETVDHAWRLYECVSRISAESLELCSLYLPVITFSAALCIWQNIRSQGDSRAHGSMKVLQLFILELQRMPWPCCHEMRETLTSLS